MVSITLNNKTKEAKAILEMLKAFSFVHVHEQSNFNAKTLSSLLEKKEGRVIKAKNSKDLFNKLRS